MRNRLAGKVAIITGGTSGIGAATVDLFVLEGATVIFTGRNQKVGVQIGDRLGGSAVFVSADATREGDIESVVALAQERYGRLDILFNNAGALTPGEVDSVTREEFDYAMTLLLGSVVFGIKHATPIMKRQRRGAIINNSSVAAIRTGMGQYLYSIAKAGVTHASKLAGVALGPYGITVNSISPGGITTPIFLGGSHAAASMEESRRDAKLTKLASNLAAVNPVRRAGVPADIAAAALFLASDEGSYVNCLDIVIDGGATAAGKTDFR